MKTYRKIFPLFALAIFSLSLATPSHAAHLKWNQLDSIQKAALAEHKKAWETYSDSKQQAVLSKEQREITRLRHYERWFNSLPKPEQAKLKSMYRGPKEKLKEYTDSLMEKYGRP